MIYKNHKGKVKSISWFEDDSGFISAGLDQMIYVWDLKNSNYPEYYFKNKGTNFDCIERSYIPGDGKAEMRMRIYACGTDKTLREISYENSL